jgi:hypothetical protein
LFGNIGVDPIAHLIKCWKRRTRVVILGPP